MEWVGVMSVGDDDLDVSVDADDDVVAEDARVAGLKRSTSLDKDKEEGMVDSRGRI